MKGFALIVCFGIACALVHGDSDEKPPKKVRDVHNECQSNPTTHLEEGVFESFNKGEAVNRTQLGIHLLCMTTKLGSQNEDGSINREAVRSIFAHETTDEAKIEEITNKCVVQGPTPGESAILLTQCIRENTSRKHEHGHDHQHHHD